MQNVVWLQGGFAWVTPPTIGRYASASLAEEYHPAAPVIVFQVCQTFGRTVPATDGT